MFIFFWSSNDLQYKHHDYWYTGWIPQVQWVTIGSIYKINLRLNIFGTLRLCHQACQIWAQSQRKIVYLRAKTSMSKKNQSCSPSPVFKSLKCQISKAIFVHLHTEDKWRSWRSRDEKAVYSGFPQIKQSWQHCQKREEQKKSAKNASNGDRRSQEVLVSIPTGGNYFAEFILLFPEKTFIGNVADFV